MRQRSPRERSPSSTSTANVEPLSVSAFLARINALLETQVAYVEGEVSGVHLSNDRYLFFDLKDETAVLHCFAVLAQMRTPLEDGMKIRVWGVPSVYPRFGKFSVTVDRVELAGEGALRRAFELLRARLEREGLFAPERKRALPRVPERIVLLTSESAAAYRDFLKVLAGRRGGFDIVFLPVRVQGVGATEEIAAAVDWANEQFPDREALVLLRGGGSLEELWSFNEEVLVRALARSRIPTVVGVGHERDVTLADLVADVRASTPSNAAELLTPTRGELHQSVRGLVQRLSGAVVDALRQRERDVARHVLVLREAVTAAVERVRVLARGMESVGVALTALVHAAAARCAAHEVSVRTRVASALRAARDRLDALTRLLGGLHPERVLERGYSITRGPKGTVLKDAAAARPGDVLATRLARGTLRSTVNR